MDISIFLAKVFGIYLVIVSLLLLIRYKELKNIYKNFFKDSSITLFTGVITLILGILLVVSHNIWEWSWVVIITILAWTTFIKGITILLFPDHMLRFAKKISNETFFKVDGVIVFLIGVLLLYFGFVA